MHVFLQGDKARRRPPSPAQTNPGDGVWMTQSTRIISKQGAKCAAEKWVAKKRPSHSGPAVVVPVAILFGRYGVACDPTAGPQNEKARLSCAVLLC